MAIDFRLAYNSGTEIVDLFPGSDIKLVRGNENIMKYSTIEVTVPSNSAQQTTQNISITTNEKQVSAPVFMLLKSTGAQAEFDFATISQYKIEDNLLIIDRLYNFPQYDIDIVLLFEEAGV